MESDTLRDSIKTYQDQLDQINLAISVTTEEPEKEDLLNLKRDIEQLIELTKESLDKLTQIVEPSTSKENIIDNEYLLFMDEMAKEGAVEKPNMSNQTNVDDDLKALEGMKCQAPHSHTWGDTVFHNALVFGVVPDEENKNFDEIKVRVMFTNPTHQEMLPCPYFLETSCKFSDEKCKFSHGETVPLSSLQEYREPRFERLKDGSKVLAKHTKGLWQRAIIKKIDDDECLVRFESNKAEASVGLKDVMPLENDTDSSSSSSDSDSEIENDSVVQASLLVNPPSQALGEWEKHTKGIGSKLMQRMGYIVGTGLGVRADGRLEPVEAVILPAGKSLDHCMQLRENAGGDENLFSVERRLKRQQRRTQARNERAYERQKSQKDVFEFLNSTLGAGVSGQRDAAAADHSRQQQLRAGSNRDLNIASFKLEEDVKRAEQDVLKIQQALARHRDVATPVHKSLRQRLHAKQAELAELGERARHVRSEQSLRSGRRKLAVF